VRVGEEVRVGLPGEGVPEGDGEGKGRVTVSLGVGVSERVGETVADGGEGSMVAVDEEAGGVSLDVAVSEGVGETVMEARGVSLGVEVPGVGVSVSANGEGVPGLADGSTVGVGTGGVDPLGRDAMWMGKRSPANSAARARSRPKPARRRARTLWAMESPP
jgi:hypothetical protein